MHVCKAFDKQLTDLVCLIVVCNGECKPVSWHSYGEILLYFVKNAKGDGGLVTDHQVWERI